MLKALITKKDVDHLIKKDFASRDEFEIIMQRDFSESKIQQTCRNIFQTWCIENKLKGLFVQIDNGGTANKFKKAKEGTLSGFPDSMLLITSKTTILPTIFIEFKKIGGQVKAKQVEMQATLTDMGYPSYITNNTIFFKEILNSQIKFL